MQYSFADLNINNLLVVVFVLGYIWEQIRITAKQGLRSYRKDWWLAYMGFMNLSFVMAGIGQIASVIKSGTEVTIFPLQENDTILFVKIFFQNIFSLGYLISLWSNSNCCTHLLIVVNQMHMSNEELHLI